ncbi:MAG: DUF3465 domain-containing protein [Steroidobacteraceae bacterium]
MKKILPVLALLIAVYAYQTFGHLEQSPRATNSASHSAANVSNAHIDDAFRNRRSNIQVRGSGTVVKVLADDREGSLHQRFIVRLSSERTVLIAHNIDLAPRIENVRAGDPIEFSGEYEWNERGGVVHWTHDDPKRQHEAGWIRFHGQLYQ